jgi:hypothetical protein
MVTLGSLKAVDNGYANSFNDYNNIGLSNIGYEFTNNQLPLNTLAEYNPSLYNLKLLDRTLTDQENWQNSWQNQYLKPAMMGIQGLTTLGNLWLGFKQYGIAKKQLGMAQEQWNMTKQELNRIRTLRDHLTQSYMNGE